MAKWLALGIIVCIIYCPGIKITDYLVGHRAPRTKIDSIFRFWISMHETKMPINHYQRQHDGFELKISNVNCQNRAQGASKLKHAYPIP